MKKFIFILMTIFFLFAITSCDFNNDDKEEDKDTRKFWAQNMRTDEFYRVEAEKLAENARCIVWAEKGSGVTAETANSIATEYMNNVYRKMMNTFGYDVEEYIDGKTVNVMEIAHYIATDKTSDAKLTILLLDIKDGYVSQADPITGGYFNPLNLFEDEHSNQLDMIYVDTYPSVAGSTQSNTILAHEMQHLMNFVSTIVFRYKGTQDIPVMDTWIDEGLSTAAEWVYSGAHPETRWRYYINDQSGLIKKGNNFFVWGNRGSESTLANIDDYATVYLFFQWLRLQSNEPDDIYCNIMTSDYSDYTAVTDAADSNDWLALLTDWFAANYINATSGRYGYKNDPTLKAVKAPMVPGNITSLGLYPGESVYSKIQTTEPLPPNSGNIKYAGLNTNIVTSGSVSGARLTYNINTAKTGSAEQGSTTGYLPPSITPGGSVSLQMSSNDFSAPFIVDAGYFLRRNENNSISYNGTRSVLSINNDEYTGKINNIPKVDRSKIKRVFIDE